MLTRVKPLFIVVFIAVLVQGCTVVKVVDAAASTAIGVTKGTAKVVGKSAKVVGKVAGAGKVKKDKDDD